MSAISQLLLARFCWNFKGSFLGASRTDSNYQVDIDPGNIYPYKEYLSCYWLNFDQNLNVGSLEHLEQIPTVTMTFVRETFVMPTYKEYLSCYWLKFYQTLKVGFRINNNKDKLGLSCAKLKPA